MTATVLAKVNLLKDMIDLFEGIRFRHVGLYDVHGVGILLDACAGALEALRLYPADLRSKEHSLNSVQVSADNFAAIHSIGDFDLSRNKSLRTLEVTAYHVGCTLRDHSPDITMEPLTHALSTITSPTFSEVTIFYREHDFCATIALSHHRQVEWFRMMYKVWGFQLALCVDVWDGVGENHVRTLKEVEAEEKVNNEFDIFLEPAVFYSPRRFPHTHGYLHPWVPL